MAWDFETDPEFQEKLDWADEFVRDEVEPLDLPSRTSSSRRWTTTAARSSTRSRRRCGDAGCGPPTSDPSSAARATAS